MNLVSELLDAQSSAVRQVWACSFSCFVSAHMCTQSLCQCFECIRAPRGRFAVHLRKAEHEPHIGKWILELLVLDPRSNKHARVSERCWIIILKLLRGLTCEASHSAL